MVIVPAVNDTAPPFSPPVSFSSAASFYRLRKWLSPNGRNFQVSGRGVRGHGGVVAAINRMTGQLFCVV